MLKAVGRYTVTAKSGNLYTNSIINIIKKKYGDLNAEGEVTVRDLVLLRQALLGVKTSAHTIVADANGDETFNIADIIRLKKYFAGEADKLGPPEDIIAVIELKEDGRWTSPDSEYTEAPITVTAVKKVQAKTISSMTAAHIYSMAFRCQSEELISPTLKKRNFLQKLSKQALIPFW